MFKSKFFVIILLCLLAIMAGCGSTATTNGSTAETEGSTTTSVGNVQDSPEAVGENKSADKIKVTTTIGQIADAAKNIGGEYVEVSSLMGPGVDPHLYQATQGDLAKLDEADIIFYNGLNLEGKMNEIFEKMAKQKPTHAVGESVPRDKLKQDEDNPDQMDPHIWFDVPIWKIAVEQVRDGLIDLDPDNKQVYTENAKRYLQELDELHEYALEQIESIPKQSRLLITAHDAFSYFGSAYGLEVMGLQGLSTDAEYGLRDVQELVDVIIERQIKAVFIESSISDRSIQAVIEGAKSKGHEVSIGGELFSDAMGAEGTPEGTYVGMVTHNVNTIVEALK